MHIVLLIAICPSDGDVKPGGPLGAFRQEQAMSRPRVSPSPFLSSSSRTTQLHYTNSYTYSHPNLSFLQTFRHFTYVTTHSPTLPSLYLRHSSFSSPSVASPTSQFIHQPFFRFSYVTSSSLNSAGERPMTDVNRDLFYTTQKIRNLSSFSEPFFMSCITFAFIASTDLNRIPFNAYFTLTSRKKIARCQIWRVQWMFLCFTRNVFTAWVAHQAN